MQSTTYRALRARSTTPLHYPLAAQRAKSKDLASASGRPGAPGGGGVRLKFGLFGAELLRSAPRSRSGPNPLKSATGGRPARGRPAAPPQKGPRSSGRAKPLKRVPGGPPQKGPRSAAGPKLLKRAATGRSAKRSWLRRRGKAAKAGGSPGGRAKLLKSCQLLMCRYMYYVLYPPHDGPAAHGPWQRDHHGSRTCSR